MEYEWTLAHPLHDIDDIVEMGSKMLELEGSCLKTDPYVFRQMLTVCSTNQLFDKSREFLAVARGNRTVHTFAGDTEVDSLLGYCWFDRGGYATYSRDEISNAKFHHVDMTLPVRTRVRLVNDMIDQHMLWAARCNIPVICSTSIRGDYDGFMKIHKKRGFTVHGSYAWIRTENAKL